MLLDPMSMQYWKLSPMLLDHQNTSLSVCNTVYGQIRLKFGVLKISLYNLAGGICAICAFKHSNKAETKQEIYLKDVTLALSWGAETLKLSAGSKNIFDNNFGIKNKLNTKYLKESWLIVL